MAEKYTVLPDHPSGIITEQLLKNLTDPDYTNGDNIYQDLIVAKVVVILVLGIVSFLVGLVPLQLAKWFNWTFESEQNAKTNGSLVISLLLCFGGGVLMFTTFIHLQPEVREELEELKRKGKAPDFDQLADLVFCMGFFFVYLIEEVVHGILDRRHNHNGDESFFHRTVSLRGCSKQNAGNQESEKGTPRVNLNRMTDGKPGEFVSKSSSTQILLDSASVVTLPNSNGSTVFEQNYPTRFSSFQSESRLFAGQVGKYSPKLEDSCSRKDAYEKGIHSGGKPSPPSSHSHGFFDDDSSSHSINLANTFRGFFTILALSFHAVFEGLAVGLENEVSNVWYLFLAIATHKFVISFCVGVDLISTRTKTLLIMLYMGSFAFVTPVGIGIGIGLSNDPTKSGTELSTVILQGMAAGTLLYVVFFEVLQREKANNISGILQLIAILAGFGVMFALHFVSGPHHHHHHHQHTDEVTHHLTALQSSQNPTESGRQHLHLNRHHHHHH